MRRLRTVPVALLGAVLLAGCATGGVSPDQAARVNGAVITVDGLAEQVEAAKSAASPGEQGAAQGATDGGNLTRQVLDLLITTELVIDGARHEGVEVTDAQVDQRVRELRERVPGGEAGFAAALAREGLTESLLRSQVRRQLAVTAVTERLVPGRTDAQLAAELRRRRDDFLQVRARHVLVADEATAVRARAELAGGGDWDAVAARLSTDQGTKDRGGDLGALSKGQTVPEFDGAAFALAGQGSCKGKVGACTSPLSQPVRTQFGWHVIQVTGIVMPTLDQVRGELEGTELEQERQRAFDAWLKELAVAADVRVNPRFGSWDPDQVRLTDRDTAPVPPTSAPAAQPGLAPSPEPATP